MKRHIIATLITMASAGTVTLLITLFTTKELGAALVAFGTTAVITSIFLFITPINDVEV